MVLARSSSSCSVCVYIERIYYLCLYLPRNTQQLRFSCLNIALQILWTRIPAKEVFLPLIETFPWWHTCRCNSYLFNLAFTSVLRIFHSVVSELEI